MNPEHLEVVNQGAEAIATWRQKHPFRMFDLRGANLRGASLSFADLLGAHLSHANLRDADLGGANLLGAHLSHAKLLGAHLSHAKLRGADLRDANLSDADLSGADLRGANLLNTIFRRSRFDSTDLTDAILRVTLFSAIDLSAAKGIETIKVEGPCSIGIDTIYLSKGKIPESFLVRCGVPDAIIKFLPSLLGAAEPIQFSSCFISFSFKDKEFCNRLHSRMREEHLRVWFAPNDMPGGKKLHEEIDRAIHLHDRLLLVLSEASMKSEWVKTEIYKARQRETKEGKQVLFPIRLVRFEAIRDWEAFDADTGKDMAREIREYFIPDFSNWKDHDAFQAEFQKLLRDLKASAT